MAEQRHKVDVRIHQEIERKGLFSVSGVDAPNGVLRIEVVVNQTHSGTVAFNRHDLCIERCGTLLFVPNKLVNEEARNQRSFDLIPSTAVLLPRLEISAVFVPEVGRELQRSGVKDVAVLNHLVVVIVFSDKVECGSLQTHIDVFGHQDDVAVFDAFLQTFHHGQNLVVGFALRQHRKLHIKGLGLNKQTTGCFTVIQRIQRDALINRAF